MKRVLSSFIVIAMLSAMFITVSASATAIAVKTTSTVFIDGAEKSFVAYNINSNNYFKLRDIAYVLNGTSKQFEVVWNAEKNAIELIEERALRTCPVNTRKSG